MAELKAFRSSLDEELIEILSPLKDHGAVVYFPFFANTFPLAFHYSCLLKDSGIDSGAIDQRIKFISWGDESKLIGSEAPKNPHVFYGTLNNVKNKDNLAQIQVTNFLPRFLFSEFNLKALATLKPEENFRDVVVNLAKQRAFDYFEVFTEIPEQADALFSELFKKNGLKHSIIGTTSAIWIFDETHLRQNTLRLFLYGAPLTNYLLHKRRRYIPFKIKLEGKKESKESFETVIVVKWADRRRQSLANVLGRYHVALYKAAEAETKADRQGFRSIQYHYNRIARLLQHRSGFHSSQEYAACLAEHHQWPDAQKQQKKEALV